MGLLRRGGDAPRVVGFDFGSAPVAQPVGQPAAQPVAQPVAEPFAPPASAAPMPAYAAAPSAPAPYAAPYAAPYDAAPYAPAPAFAPPPPPGYEQAQTAPVAPQWRPGLPPPPSWGLESGPAPKSRRSVSLRGIGSLVAFALFASGGYRAYQRYFGEPFEPPERIGESMLMRDEASLRDAEELLSGVYNVPRATSGVYGVNGYVTMLLVAGDGSERNAQDVYDSASQDVKSEKLRLGKPAKYGGVICAELSGGTDVYGAMCVWGSRKSDGLLMHLNVNDLDEAARLTQEAWDGVEA